MCVRGEPVVPSGAGEAVEMLLAGFGWLARADLGSVPVAVQAECLRQLGRVQSVQAAAQAAVLSAFDYQGGFADDGQGSSRGWLIWQTQASLGAAGDAVGWMRRLRAHPAVAAALRDARVSSSWAREICGLTDKLPESARADADAILLAAAAEGAELRDLAGLAEQMRRRLAEPDRDRGRGLEDRRLRLATTVGGAGKLDGDLTGQCAAALQVVLDCLGKKMGPEDDRTRGQRDHDALAEACRRLIGSGCLPDRAGQPAQLQVHITLEELTRRLAEAGRDGSGGAGSTGAPGPGSAGAPGPGSAGGTGPGGTGASGTGSSGTGAGSTWQDATGAGGPSRTGTWQGGIWQGGPGIARQLWPRLTDDSGPVPDPVPGWPPAAPGDECDACIVPVVSGYLDHDLLDQLMTTLAGPGRAGNLAAGERPLIRLDRDRLREVIITHAVALVRIRAANSAKLPFAMQAAT